MSKCVDFVYNSLQIITYIRVKSQLSGVKWGTVVGQYLWL